MNFTTQAAQDILGKIERDPAEMRHWRQLLILCFDQKSVDTLQTLQVIVAAIEQIWNQRRQKVKEEHEAAKDKQRFTGNKEPLPSLAVLTVPLTMRQKDVLVKLAHDPHSSALLYRFGFQLEEDFNLPQAAQTLYEQADAFCTDDGQLDQKISEALKRLAGRHQEKEPEKAPAPALELVISPESMGVKSPTYHRPSVAALIKRSGRLSVDRGRIQVDQNILAETNWPETQKKLDEAMSRLLNRTAEVCETAPRPMRVPRSIAPAQWLEFLEGHITLLLATLEAQDIVVRPTVNLEQAPPQHDVAARSDFVLALIEEIDRSLHAITPPEKPAPPKPEAHPPDIRIEDIFELIDAGDLNEAERHLRKLETGPTPKEQLSEVWFHLGLAFQNNHDSNHALMAYERARELNPQNLQAWFNGGMIQQEEGMLRPALESYRHAIEIDPEQSKIWCNLGALQFQLGEFQESVDSLNRAVGLKPDYARAWDNLAGSLCALDQLAEAERCCHRALNFKSDYAEPYFKLGSIYFQQGRMEEAERAFRQVLEWQPGYPLAGHYLAMVLARTHRIAAALAICERAATPPGETELPSMAWNEMAFHLYEHGQYSEAIHAYEKALTFTPERAVIWLDAGVAHQQLGEIDQARRHYEQAVELDPELARAWHNLGAVKHELGDVKGAQEALDEAERLLARGR
ncbi:MAG TPA: tetratricopeptide repeat protein [Candidatus Methylacidiphilales bacterium]|nr:tetratricopeptide repeat protein [Candidatus Methylacidiphilales bacterium]